MDTTTTDHLLSTTRAVRRKLDLDRPVELDVITECLRLAIQAPTPGNTQQWRWLVVRDQAVKNQLGALFREVGNAYMRAKAAGLGEAAKHGANARAMASGQYLIDVIERVPVFVIPCLQGRPPVGNAAQSVYYGGIFPAVWNFQLALRSRGLGSTLTSYHLEREAEAARILGIPDDVTQVGLLPIGYATVPDFKPGPRTPVEEITYVDSWGA
ncbi:nitroreductase family protein [Actinocrispum wychmicini]|uniref:Nitroreductase n=1 Tax=Actinocrispum wychmicini TaxID=1213861 RepID=A0A4R2JT26_9PSEU|nr:nitroreductase family protein [Actinocrispum wychmicini]TCO62277.1 nitroreductase [Actinocrispum wychmicini]